MRHAARHLLLVAREESKQRTHAWIGKLDAALRADPCRRVNDLAHEVGLSPAWIGPAYRHHVGESLKDTSTRLRVECAARLLRESDRSLSRIAADSGFCDQSHMNRLFRRVLGRPPALVRQERLGFRR